MKVLILLMLLFTASFSDIKWKDPSWNECEKNGGKIPKGEKICVAEWEKAKDICNAIGTRLPTLNELTKIITECGGIVDNRESNSQNSSMRECCEKKGFSTDYFYWSRDKFKKSHMAAWSVNFNQGYASIGNKYYSIYVRCVDTKK